MEELLLWSIPAILTLAVVFDFIYDYIPKPEHLCSHSWKVGNNPSYHGVRYCKICKKIEIQAFRMEWCDNYANLKIDEVKNGQR